VLVTDRDALPDEVRAEIERLGATRAVLLGGTAALGAGVEADVRTMGLEVQRLAGGDRFETAGLVAAALPPGPEAFVVEGSSPDPRRGWPDAVSASWLAARSGAAILLATRDALPAATAAALRARGTERVIVVGGSAAISADVARQVGVIAPDVERVGGSSRYDTARALAERSGATDGLTAFVTTGEDFPDALAVGPTVAARAAVLLTVHGDDLAASPATAEWLHTHRDELAGVVLVGGTDAVSAGVEQAIRNLVDQA
jgi:putative cell wall-binding protein